MNDPIDSDSEGNPLTYSDVICTEDTIVDDLNEKFNIVKVRRLVEEMKNERNKTIIILRYGLGGREPMTQQEVADILGISRSYVLLISYYKWMVYKKLLSDHSFFYFNIRTSTFLSV